MVCAPVIAFIILFVIQTIFIIFSRANSNIKTRKVLITALWDLLWGALAWYFCEKGLIGHAWFIFFLPLFALLYLLIFVIFAYYANGDELQHNFNELKNSLNIQNVDLSKVTSNFQENLNSVGLESFDISLPSCTLGPPKCIGLMTHNPPVCHGKMIPTCTPAPFTNF